MGVRPIACGAGLAASVIMQEKRSKMMMMELTLATYPNQKILTVDGEIRYIDWVEREKAKIEKDPARSAIIVKRVSNRISLWVNRVAGEDNMGADKCLEELM